MTQDSAAATTETTEGVSQEAPATTTSSQDVTDSAPSSGAAEQEVSIQDRIKDEFLKAYGDGSEEKAAAPDDQSEPAAQDQATTDDQPEADEKAATDDVDDKFRISDDVFKALPQGVKQRIGHLNATAKKAKRELAEVTSKLEGAQPVIERMRSLETFVTENRIDPKNLGAAFGMMAKLSKGDFQGFLADIQPWVNAARMASGQAVHPDLQTHVDQGEMTEDMARRITAERLRAARVEHENKALTARQTQAREASARQQTVKDVLDAVDRREAELRADPDYAALEPVVKQQMEFALKRGVPRTRDEAVQLVNEAVDLARRLRPKTPAPKPTIPQPSTSNMDRGRPKPASTKEAIMNGLLDWQGRS